MIIYKANKEICYVKDLKIKNNSVKIVPGYKTSEQPSFFYKNFLGVIIDLETGYPQISQTEAWENVEYRARQNCATPQNISCPYLNPAKLEPVKEIPKKHFKRFRKQFKEGNITL